MSHPPPPEPELGAGSGSGTPAVPAAARRKGGYYQLIQGGDGAFRFTLRAGNHETILESVVYWSRQAALDAVDALRLRAQDLANFRTVAQDDGRLWFEVICAEGRCLARSAPYSTGSGVAGGIASVRRHCVSTAFRGLVFRTTAAD
jgi:uncharacterized protein